MRGMRCFVAIEIHDTLRERLTLLQRELKACGWPMNWARAEHLHLTIKFLGEIDDTRIDDVCSAVRDASRRQAAFSLFTGKLGCFPPRGPARVIWLGVDDPDGALSNLHERVETALEPLGIARESRAFHPHLTLGRTRSRVSPENIRDILAKHDLQPEQPLRVEEVVVFQSELTPRGPIHTPLAHVRLPA